MRLHPVLWPVREDREGALPRRLHLRLHGAVRGHGGEGVRHRGRRRGVRGFDQLRSLGRRLQRHPRLRLRRRLPDQLEVELYPVQEPQVRRRLVPHVPPAKYDR